MNQLVTLLVSRLQPLLFNRALFPPACLPATHNAKVLQAYQLQIRHDDPLDLLLWYQHLYPPRRFRRRCQHLVLHFNQLTSHLVGRVASQLLSPHQSQLNSPVECPVANPLCFPLENHLGSPLGNQVASPPDSRLVSHRVNLLHCLLRAHLRHHLVNPR